MASTERTGVRSGRGRRHDSIPEGEYSRVVCAIDSNMVYPLAVLVFSLAQFATRPFRLTVGYLDGSLTSEDRDFLSAVVSGLAIPLDFMNLENDDRFVTQGHISPTTFAKFLLSDAILEEHLWIDADTIALPGWDAIFDEIALTTPQEGLVVARRGDKKTTGPVFTGEASNFAFNAGVLGWPVGLRKDWHSPLSSLALVDTQEQYLFNSLYAESARWVSNKFNTLTYRIDSLDQSNLPYIIHYAGPHKPWHLVRGLAFRCLQHNCPWSKWFEMEGLFLSSLSEKGNEQAGAHYRILALRSGKIRWTRDGSGYRLLRLLQWLGPLAPVLVTILSWGKESIPRGTHPIH